jgi:uncharacterized protein YjbJ (UPF0337 family)
MNRWNWSGHWKQCRGTIKEALGRVTHNRLLEFDGQQDRINGRLQVHGSSGRRRPITGVGRTLMRRPGKRDPIV